MLLDLLGINKVIKQIKCRLQKLEKNTNTGGNFIPLTGTEVGSPVTGDIEMTENTAKNLWTPAGNAPDDFHAIFFAEGGIQIYYNNDSTLDSFTTIFSSGGIYISSNVSGVEDIGINKGISSTLYYGANYDDLTYVQKKYVDQKVADSRPYKVYTALLSQSGTDAPVATVLENTLGGDVVWSRDDLGAYVGTLIGAFTENKTKLSIDLVTDGDYSTLYFGNFYISNEDTIGITTFGGLPTSQGDSVLSNTPIEIRVYN